MVKKKTNLSERMAALEERQTRVEQQIDEIVESLWPEAVHEAEFYAEVEGFFHVLKESWKKHEHELERGFTVADIDTVRRRFWMKINTAAENGMTSVDWRLILEQTFAEQAVDISNREFQEFFGSRVGD